MALTRMYRCRYCGQVDNSLVCFNCGSYEMIDVTTITGKYECLKTKRQKDGETDTKDKQKSI